MKKIFAIALVLVLIFSLCSCSEKEEMVDVTLYFVDSEYMYLEGEVRTIVKGDAIEKSIVEEVIKGPTKEGLNKAISGDVKVLSAKTEGDICTVDLSGEFREFNTGGTAKESFAIMSIVYSLCELPDIKAVKINIDKNPNAEFGGHFTLEEPFYPQSFPDMVK